MFRRIVHDFDVANILTLRELRLFKLKITDDDPYYRASCKILNLKYGI